MDRTLTDELLDHLDPADFRAVRSRQDLRFIDVFLGNSRWILSILGALEETSGGIVELGAGEGNLCKRIGSMLPGTPVTGLDRIASPDNLAGLARWVRGDFLETLPVVTGSVCCGALILHHLDTGRLRRLGMELRRFSHLVFTEPHRSPYALRMAALASPVFGEVTRHDMPASIRAGFRPGELPALLGLDSTEWVIRETVTLRGSLRLAASRR